MFGSSTVATEEEQTGSHQRLPANHVSRPLDLFFSAEVMFDHTVATLESSLQTAGVCVCVCVDDYSGKKNQLKWFTFCFLPCF